MPFAPCALDLSMLDSQRDIFHLGNIFLRKRSPEAGPTRAGIEFRLRTEQRRVAADTAKDAAAMLVQADARERHLRICLPGDIKGIFAQPLKPLFICLHDLWDSLLAEVLSILAEVDDRNLTRRVIFFAWSSRLTSESNMIGAPEISLCFLSDENSQIKLQRAREDSQKIWTATF